MRMRHIYCVSEKGATVHSTTEWSSYYETFPGPHMNSYGLRQLCAYIDSKSSTREVLRPGYALVKTRIHTHLSYQCMKYLYDYARRPLARARAHSLHYHSAGHLSKSSLLCASRCARPVWLCLSRFHVSFHAATRMSVFSASPRPLPPSRCGVAIAATNVRSHAACTLPVASPPRVLLPLFNPKRYTHGIVRGCAPQSERRSMQPLSR